MKNFLYGILFCLMLFCAGPAPAHAQTLVSGTTTAGTVPTPPCTICYDTQTFAGTAGQGVIGTIVSSISSCMNWSVYKPDGTFLTSSCGYFNLTNLPVTGTYTVRISSPIVGVGGGYTVYYVAGGGGTSFGALTSGTTITDTLPIGGLTSYTFSGTSGQGMQLRFAAPSLAWNVNIRVYLPSGAYQNINTDSYVMTLPSTGTYTVVLQGASSTSGAFSLAYVIGGGAVSDGNLNSGDTVGPGTLPAGLMQSFTFNGTSGHAAAFSTGISFPITTYWYKPDGSYWTSYGGANWISTSSLPNTGTWTVVIVAQTYSNTDTDNVFYVQGNDNVSEGYLNTTLPRANGTMPVGGLMSFKYEAKASQSLTVSTTCSFAPSTGCYWLGYKPDGSYWGAVSNSSWTGTLPAVNGEYTLVLYEPSFSKTGNYSITLTTPAPAVPPSVDCPICDMLANMAANMASIFGQSLNMGAALSASPGSAAGAPQGAPSGSGASLSAMGNTVTAEPAAINGPIPFTGSTMQFDTGFKQQTVTDYNAGGLSFTRFYRSDSTWTSTMGAKWRHNYARVLAVVPGTSASITDGTGVTNAYTWSSGTSTWVPSDPSTRATLQTVTGGWVYTLPNNTVEKYNSSEQLTRVEYFGGGALNLTYNGSGQLTGIANENGRSLSLTYDGSGRVSTLVTPDGTFTYNYDTNNNLIKLTKPDTKTKQYGFTSGTYVNALTGVTNEKGNQILNVIYAPSGGNVVSSNGAGSVSNYSVAYNADYTSTGTNPLGKSFTYHYVNNNWSPGIDIRRITEVDGAATTNTPASSEYYNYDYLGRVIGHTDSKGNGTRYAYDSRGNVTRIMEGVYSALQRTTTITYNATWNVPSLITQPGKTTAFAYDAYGRVTSVTITDTATSATRVTSYSYYANSTDGSGNTILGRLQTITGPRTDLSETTTYAYDANFNLTTITNALSQVTTITARDSAGRPTKITDPNSVETDLTYDSNGRLQTSVQAAGTALAATTTFTYDDDGDLTKVTLPNSVYVQYTYDTAQRLTGITDALGNTETYTLDNAGNVTQVVYKNTTPTTTYTHTKNFDELSRMLKSIGASSQTANYAYDTDSNLTSYTDPNTNATAYAYDALNRVNKITNALSGITTPAHNALDQLSSVKDQRNNTTTYTYNAFGDVTGETNPDRGTISYTVDKAGNVTQRIDARSIVTNYTYDAINRLTSVAYPSDSSLAVSLTYDSSSGCGTSYIGHLCSVTDAAGTMAYQYDVLGRVTQEKDTRGALNFTTSYSYDLAGNITGLTLPSGRSVSYTRDANGYVSGVSALVNGTSTTLASSITYLPFGPMNALTYGNSLTFSGTFDQDYNPTNRTVSGSIYNWTYTTDSNGNIKTAGSTTYGYDALNRVNTENPGTSVSYTYDATSNRLTKGSTTTTVPSTSNKISAVGSNSYTYDSSGNITGDGVNTYTWNAEGELGVVKVGGTTVGTYTYNRYRQRAKKVASSTAYYVYGAGGLLYGEYDASGNFIREYIYLNGAPIAQIDAGSPEVLTYIHTDHLGTPRFGTNASGTQVWSWNNDAFGTSTPAGTATVNLRMPGQYYDSESGLFYNLNRIYNPAIGRYISSDPVGIAGGLNTFGYAAQNPVLWIDNSGLYFYDLNQGIGDPDKKEQIIRAAYDLLSSKCTIGGHWMAGVLQEHGLSLWDVFYGPEVEIDYGYYKSSEDTPGQEAIGGLGHTRWDSGFGGDDSSFRPYNYSWTNWGNQPDKSTALSAQLLDMDPKVAAVTFAHELAQQFLINFVGNNMHGPQDQEWAQYADSPCTCGNQ